MIDERQENALWGSGFLAQLARDLKSEFPDIKGFSRSNLSYIRKWYRFYRASEKIQQLVGQIPWGHNMLLLDKLSDTMEAGFYAQKTVEHGWSRAVLAVQIESQLYHREGRAITNFDKTLPAPQSELAQQTLKDPYVFKPEYAGKMNFYLSAADDLLRAEGDNPSIGILLCKEKRGRTVVEYALRDIAKPLGVSGFTHSLPDDLQGQLPSVETLKAELLELDEEGEQ